MVCWSVSTSRKVVFIFSEIGIFLYKYDQKEAKQVIQVYDIKDGGGGTQAEMRAHF